jgi:hypothetical protein
MRASIVARCGCSPAPGSTGRTNIRRSLQNTNGVYLRLSAQRKGLSLSLGADGMVIQLGS